MEVHANAKLAPKGRLTMVRRIENENWTIARAADAAGVSTRTASKWRSRFRSEGQAGLTDRSSRPKRSPSQVPTDRVQAIMALRKIRMTGQEIASLLTMPSSTVSLVLKRIGLGKLSRLEPLEPIVRYEKDRPGELIHVDVKRLGRIDGGPGKRITGTRKGRRRKAGWEYVHIAIDDATRIAYAEVLDDEQATTAVQFLKRAIDFYAGYGIRVQAVMTDNGSAYTSHAHRDACEALGIRHVRTRIRRPQTNGKAERFIQTLTGRWAWGAIYGSSNERKAALSGWLDFYNWERPHGSLAKRPPGERLAQLNRNNLHGSYT